MVFDCSARYHGQSLNDHLLQDPDLTSKLRKNGFHGRYREDVLPSKGKENRSGVLTIYTGKPEIPVGKLNGSRHSVGEASDNMGCYFFAL